MDLDADGNDEILSGSYWPGDIYVFWGQKGGPHKKGEPLKDSDGKNLNAGGTWKSDREPDYDSLASAPFAFDHDGDGDLDLLVGNIGGRVILIPNEGTRQKPSFNTQKRAALEAGGEPIKVPGGDAGPVVADWDEDGKPDLLVGSGDGSVHFYRNEGTREAPKYARGAELLSKSRGGYSNPVEKPEGPGVRTKLCVTDWNGDGRPDLLVGDFWYQKAPSLQLTPEQEAKRDELRRKRTELSTKLSALYRELGDKFGESEEYRKVSQEYGEVHRQLDPLEARPKTRGSVWLFLRQPKAK